jgi:hypothetical protein
MHYLPFYTSSQQKRRQERERGENRREIQTQKMFRRDPIVFFTWIQQDCDEVDHFISKALVLTMRLQLS